MATSLKCLLCALLATGLISCDFLSSLGHRKDDHRKDANASRDQQILFEVEYVNFAWGLQWRGLYVDHEGSVWRYDHGHETWQTTRRDAYTLEDLLDKYSHERELITSVSSQELAKARRLIGPAGGGRLTEPVGRCYDFGTVTFRAFRYDIEDELYHPILLYQAGDIARKNASTSAIQLTAWLMTIDSTAVVQHCLP